MNKTTPDKEKLREEWYKEAQELGLHHPLVFSLDGAANWWLDKMEAQKASTIAIIEGMKKDYMFEEGNPEHEQFEESMMYHETMGEAHEAGYNSALDDLLSILRKEI